MTTPALRIAVVALFVLACGACVSTRPYAQSVATFRADSAIRTPASVTQGSLLFGSVSPGSVLNYAGRNVRIADDGRFVVGVARTQVGVVTLKLTRPDGSASDLTIPVVAREFPVDRVEGVPEQTVNPPPEIVARIEREQAQVNAARTRDDDRTDFEAKFIWPVTGRISGLFGNQRIYNGTPSAPHSGMDIAAPAGTPVHAPAGGIVTFANPDLYLTGGTVLIDHGHGVSSNFLHLSRIDVSVGERVAQGQVIGQVGATGRATGPHLHWGMNWFDVRVDPLLLMTPPGQPPPTEAH